jgi:hypothetical protein
MEQIRIVGKKTLRYREMDNLNKRWDRTRKDQIDNVRYTRTFSNSWIAKSYRQMRDELANKRLNRFQYDEQTMEDISKLFKDIQAYFVRDEWTAKLKPEPVAGSPEEIALRQKISRLQRLISSGIKLPHNRPELQMRQTA